MSLLDRIRVCQRWKPDDYRPFVVGSDQVGWVRHESARRLAAYDRVFRVGDQSVRLHPALGSAQARTEAVAEVLDRFRDRGEFPNWRNEPYPVLNRWGAAPLMTIERAAAPLFGVRGFGVHLNGYQRSDSGLRLWVGRRSRHKPTGAGKLDNLVAGGQPAGISVRENLVKECAEEADLSRAMAERAIPVGAVSYITERDEGLRNDVLFCYDLPLPEDFEPRNTDGEVEAFYLWPIGRVMEALAETDDFKFNVALVNIDFLVRHGFVTAADPDYLDILHGLRLPE